MHGEGFDGLNLEIQCAAEHECERGTDDATGDATGRSEPGEARKSVLKLVKDSVERVDVISHSDININNYTAATTKTHKH